MKSLDQFTKFLKFLAIFSAFHNNDFAFAFSKANLMTRKPKVVSKFKGTSKASHMKFDTKNIEFFPIFILFQNCTL